MGCTDTTVVVLESWIEGEEGGMGAFAFLLDLKYSLFDKRCTYTAKEDAWSIFYALVLDCVSESDRTQVPTINQ